MAHDEFQHHHEHLRNILSAVEHTADSGHGFGTLNLLLDHLARYVEQHFAAEESLMEKTGFPQLERHRAEHDHCRHRIGLLRKETRCGAAAVEALNFLRDWLTRHESECDRHFAEFREKVA